MKTPALAHNLIISVHHLIYASNCFLIDSLFKRRALNVYQKEYKDVSNISIRMYFDVMLCHCNVKSLYFLMGWLPKSIKILVFIFVFCLYFL